ncbi:pheromone-binding protein-related protein 6-like [Leptopilina heterotoma]|uniref:pheromone-binding protein-related protein 6-like n=1 Tax=Leptopilina heterotoma TaxID=63436 RepID=UPI001CAA1AC0|nr:pheromone-binding protein-related protein 6-like [Leptopilina heterotoma]
MKGFRSLLVLCILVHVAIGKIPEWIPPEMMDMVKGDKTRCMNEHGTTEAMIQDASEGKFIDDHSLSCYMFCLFDAFSLADEDGNVDADLLSSLMPEKIQAIALEVFGTCGDIGADNPCDKFYKMAVCAYAKRPDIWFMV